MKLLARLFALFLIMPVVELALLVQVDKLIGFWPTIGVIIFTGLLGGYLARREGLSVWRRLNERLNTGGLPGRELLDGVIILVAGALLITPGVVTDLVGFLGLLPPSRAVIRRIVEKRIKKAMAGGAISVVGFDGWADAPGYAVGPEEVWSGQPREVPRYSDEQDPPAGP